MITPTTTKQLLVQRLRQAISRSTSQPQPGPETIYATICHGGWVTNTPAHCWVYYDDVSPFGDRYRGSISGPGWLACDSPPDINALDEEHETVHRPLVSVYLPGVPTKGPYLYNVLVPDPVPRDMRDHGHHRVVAKHRHEVGRIPAARPSQL